MKCHHFNQYGEMLSALFVNYWNKVFEINWTEKCVKYRNEVKNKVCELLGPWGRWVALLLKRWLVTPKIWV